MTDVALDTAVLIDLMRKRAAVQQMIDRFASPAVSHVVVGELLLGGLKSTRRGEMDKISAALE